MARYLVKVGEHSKVLTISSIHEQQVRKSTHIGRESQRTISSMEMTLAHLITIIQCHQVVTLVAQTTDKEARTRELEASQ
jgi:hypothetical protein